MTRRGSADRGANAFYRACGKPMHWVRLLPQSSTPRLVRRGQIAGAPADGAANILIRRVGEGDPPTVGHWRKKWFEPGIIAYYLTRTTK